MVTINFPFNNNIYSHQFFFGTKDINWFGIKDSRGIWYDCCYNVNNNTIEIFGQDSNYLIEKSCAL